MQTSFGSARPTTPATRFGANLRLTRHGKPVTNDYDSFVAITVLQEFMKLYRTDDRHKAHPCHRQGIRNEAGDVTEFRIFTGQKTLDNYKDEMARPADEDLDIAKLLDPEEEALRKLFS